MVFFAMGPFEQELIQTISCLETSCKSGERVFADRVYFHFDPTACVTPEGFRAESSKDKQMKKVKVIKKIIACHETVNARLKAFNILKSFRHDQLKHGICFKAVAALVQLDIEIASPLFQITKREYNDTA